MEQFLQGALFHQKKLIKNGETHNSNNNNAYIRKKLSLNKINALWKLKFYLMH